MGRSQAGVPQASALFLSAFVDELMRAGVRHFVVSPGSRSTPLSMVVYEASLRWPERVALHIDVDERGAAFLALGIAKATGRPACVICTSGTAVANYYPAVIEAETSRVPLVVLSADRPLDLQGLGAPQTCDQIKAFGDHVAQFWQMPACDASVSSIAFARQVAREVAISAGGKGCPGGASPAAPVHVNFPLAEPLTPDLSVPGLFEEGRSLLSGQAPRSVADAAFSGTVDCPGGEVHARALESGLAYDEALPAIVRARSVVDYADVALQEVLSRANTLIVAGEGSVRDESDARRLIEWARLGGLPIIADPLSNLRSFADPVVIDNYDNVLGCSEYPRPEAMIRFGRWPLSKKTFQALGGADMAQVVVDPVRTRDFVKGTDVFIQCEPWEFVSSTTARPPRDAQRAFADAWMAANDEQRVRIEAADEASQGVEGAFVRAIIDAMPEGSCLFSANSMSVRAVDTFYTKREKRIDVLCNRGQNGIDGTVSTAIGASYAYDQTTFLTGDLTMQHDMNALALQRELLKHPAGGRDTAQSIVIVLLNNNGGAIFDMLPQQSEDPYFERLFLVPQDIRFSHVAAAFGVPYRAVSTVSEFKDAYAQFLGTPGITFIEVEVPLSGVKDRYGRYW